MKLHEVGKMKLSQYIPATICLGTHLTIIVVGIVAIHSDWNIKNTSCEVEAHILKFCLCNLVFTALVLISYFSFPAGGEVARARAVVMMIFHFGLATWGLLARWNVGASCKLEMRHHYEIMNLFQRLCIMYNYVLMTCTILHEMYLGQQLGADFTLLPAKAQSLAAIEDANSGDPETGWLSPAQYSSSAVDATTGKIKYAPSSRGRLGKTFE